MAGDRDKASENPYEPPLEPGAPTKRWQFRLVDLLAVVGIAAVLLAMMQLWEWLGFIWLTAVGSAYGVRFAWHRRSGESFVGGLVGGCAGGEAGLIATLIGAYTSAEPWEDEGLGFGGCLLVFTPLAVQAGGIFGALAWFMATGAKIAIRKAGMRSPPSTSYWINTQPSAPTSPSPTGQRRDAA